MTEPIKVIVCGALGRMGRRVIEAVLSRPDLALAGLTERPDHPLQGRELGPELGRPELKLSLAASLAEAAEEAQVYIDFSSPAASLNYLAQAVELKLAAVIGSTGFSPAEKKELAQAAEKIPILWAPNMSTGVNVMFRAAALLAKMLGPDYDLEIVEAHHRLKKDAPSGTALKLLEILASARGLEPERALRSGRGGQVGERSDSEIGVMAVRGGDIVGDHTVIFAGPGERLELIHRAQSRDTFAQGAVRAALWLAGQPKGLYDIEDSLSSD